MAIQIALAWSKECEAELLAKGFKPTTVYAKHVDSAGNTEQQIKKGESEFWRMKHKPFQFLVSSWWGAGPD